MTIPLTAVLVAVIASESVLIAYFVGYALGLKSEVRQLTIAAEGSRRRLAVNITHETWIGGRNWQ